MLTVYCCDVRIFHLLIRPPRRSTLFPYTTLFRSFCGSKRARPRFTPSEIGEQPVACAPKNFTGLSSTQPSVTSSLKAFAIFVMRSEEHTSELQSPDHLVCRLLLEKKKKATVLILR